MFVDIFSITFLLYALGKPILTEHMEYGFGFTIATKNKPAHLGTTLLGQKVT